MTLVAHHAVIAGTHVFSPTFILDARFGYGRFNLHALKDGAAAGANLGEKLGVHNANQGPFSYGLPIFAPSNYTGIGGPASLPTLRLENTFNPNISFTKLCEVPHVQVGHQHRAPPDYRLPDESGRRPVQLRSDLHLRPE